MLEVLLYDIIFFGTYIGVSTWICIQEKYNLFGSRFYRELERGCKGLLIQLPVSNVLVSWIMPYTHMINEFSLRGCLWYIIAFDFLQFFIHWLLHLNRRIYRSIHHEHHKTIYVIPFSATIMDPVEYVLTGTIPTVLPLFFIEINLLGWVLVNMMVFIHGLFIHSSYKLPYEGYLLGAQNHATHHMVRNKNFGFLLPWWDQIFNTYTDHIPLDRIRNRIRHRYEKT